MLSWVNLLYRNVNVFRLKLKQYATSSWSDYFHISVSTVHWPHRADTGAAVVQRHWSYHSKSNVRPVEPLLLLTDDYWRHTDEWRSQRCWTTVESVQVTCEQRASVDGGHGTVRVVQTPERITTSSVTSLLSAPVKNQHTDGSLAHNA